MLRPQRFPEERVVEQVDLAHGKVIGSPPPCIDEFKFLVEWAKGCRFIRAHDYLTGMFLPSTWRDLSRQCLTALRVESGCGNRAGVKSSLKAARAGEKGKAAWRPPQATVTSPLS